MGPVLVLSLIFQADLEAPRHCAPQGSPPQPPTSSILFPTDQTRVFFSVFQSLAQNGLSQHDVESRECWGQRLGFILMLLLLHPAACVFGSVVLGQSYNGLAKLSAAPTREVPIGKLLKGWERALAGLPFSLASMYLVMRRASTMAYDWD